MSESKSDAFPLGDSPIKIGCCSVAVLVQRMPVEPLRHKTLHRFGQPAQHAARRFFRPERCKHAGPRTGHSRLAEIRQPFEMTRDFGVSTDHHGLQVDTTHACGKGRYYEGWRV